MSIHYKFKSATEYSTVTFDGIHISVADLKKEILEQKHLKQSSDADLQITDAQTKEVYEDENALIPKNTSVIVARVPVTEKKRSNGPGHFGGGGGGHYLHRSHHPRNQQPVIQPSASALAKNVDLASMDVPEDEKIRQMMSQSTADYDPSKYQRLRGQSQHGHVPYTYACKKCGRTGHWIKDCPLQNEHSENVKKSTGIPRSFMVHVEGPSVPGAMMTPEGRYAVPAVDHAAYMEEKNKILSAPPPKPKIPDELVCTLCDDLMTDALLVPCCANSYCDECIRKALLDSDDQECPSCHEKDILPTSLIANRFLRTTVTKFKEQTGYSKPVTIPIKKDNVVVVDLTEKKEEAERRKLSLDELPDDLFPHSPRKVDPDADDKENDRHRHADDEKTDLYDFNDGSIPSPFAQAAPEPIEKESSEQAIRTIGTTTGSANAYYPEPKYKDHHPPPRHYQSRGRGDHHHHYQQRPPKEHYSKDHYPKEHYPKESYSKEHYSKEQHFPKEHYQKEHYRHPRTPLQSGMPPLPSAQHHSQQQQQPPPQHLPPQHLQQPPPRRPPIQQGGGHMQGPPPSEIHEPSPPGFTDVLPLPPGEDRIPTPTSRGGGPREEQHHHERLGEGRGSDASSREAEGLPPRQPGAAPLLPLPLLPLPGIPPFNPTQPPPGFPPVSSAPPTSSSSTSSQQQPPPTSQQQQQQQPPPMNKSAPPPGLPPTQMPPVYSGPPPNYQPPYHGEYRGPMPPGNGRHGGYPPGGPHPRERERRYPSRERSMRKLPPLREPRPRDRDMPIEPREGAIIDDPLKEFERIMREKDRQKKLQQPMRKRSRSRSFSPGPGRRSPSPFGKRSRSRSYSRSPSPKRKRPGPLRRRNSYSRSSSRSPPPLRRHLRSRSRSRNRSITPTSQLSKRQRSPRRTAPPFSPSPPPPRFPPPRKEKDEFYDRQLRYEAPGGRYYNPNNGGGKPYPPRDYDPKYDMPPNPQKFEPGLLPPPNLSSGGKYDKFEPRPPRDYPPHHVHGPPPHHHHPPPHGPPGPDRGPPPYRERERNMRGMDRGSEQSLPPSQQQLQQQQPPPQREGLMGHRPPPPISSYDYDPGIMPPGTEGNGEQPPAPQQQPPNTTPTATNNGSSSNANNTPTQQPPQNVPSLFELEISPPANFPPSSSSSASKSGGPPPSTSSTPVPGNLQLPPPQDSSTSSYYSSHQYPNQPPPGHYPPQQLSHKDHHRRSRSRGYSEKDNRERSGRDRDIRDHDRGRGRGRDHHHHHRSERERDHHRDSRGGRDRDRERDRERDRDVRGSRDTRELRERDSNRDKDVESLSVSLTPDSEIGGEGVSRSSRDRDGKRRHHVKKSRDSSSEKVDKKDKKERKEKKKHKRKKEKEEKKSRKVKKPKSVGGKTGKSVSEDDQTTTADEAGTEPSRRNSLTENTTPVVDQPQETTIPIEAIFVNTNKEDVSTTKETGTPIPTIGNKTVVPVGHELDSLNSNLTVIVCDSTVKSPDRNVDSMKKSLGGSITTAATSIVTYDKVDLKTSDQLEAQDISKIKGDDDDRSFLNASHEKGDVDEIKKHVPTLPTTGKSSAYSSGSKAEDSFEESHEKIKLETLPSLDVSADDELIVKEREELFDDTNKVEIPESIPSKWDKFGEDDMDGTNRDDEEGDRYLDSSGNLSKDSQRKKVTSEVLKRAENAIFHKAISAISPFSPSTRSSSSTRKGSSPPPVSSQSTTSSSSKRKVYIEKLEGAESEKEDKSKDLDSRETRQKGSSFQVTLSSSTTEPSIKSDSGIKTRSVRDRLGSKISEEHSSRSRHRSSSSRERERDKGKDKHHIKSQVTATAQRERERDRRRRSKSPLRRRDRSSRSKSRDRGRIREKDRTRRSSPGRRSRSRSPRRSTSKTRRERLRSPPSSARLKNRDKAPLELASSQKRQTSRSSSRENRRRSRSASKRRSGESSSSRTRTREKGGARSREGSHRGASTPSSPQTRAKPEKTEHEESWKKQADKFVPIGGMEAREDAAGGGERSSTQKETKTSDDEKDSFQTTPIPSLASRKQKGRINIKLSTTSASGKGDQGKSSSSSSEEEAEEHHVTLKHEASSKPAKSSDSMKKKERKKAKRRRSESTSSSSSDDSAPRKSKKSKKKKKKSKKKKKVR